MIAVCFMCRQLWLILSVSCNVNIVLRLLMNVILLSTMSDQHPKVNDEALSNDDETDFLACDTYSLQTFCLTLI